MYRLARPLLFSFAPESAHGLTFTALRAGGPVARGLATALASRPAPQLERVLAGLRFPGPIGLAAGLDKDGELARFWPALGFGFVELGTVTPRPQAGNPAPRLFRVASEKALINRMGFNNGGVDQLVARLERQHKRPCPLGVNLGKQRTTSLKDAAADYEYGARRAAPVADYLVINVSSPNTPGLRALQDAHSLREIVSCTVGAAAGRPVFVKLSPDLGDEALDEAVAVSEAAGAAGFIATNTTLTRPIPEPLGREEGGLSGAPLHPLAVRAVARVRAATRLPLIGVGGVRDIHTARAMLAAGADLLQLYTALIYEGPGLVSRLNRGLAQAAGPSGGSTP